MGPSRDTRGMPRNYLAVATGNILRRKVSSLINIGGLSGGGAMDPSERAPPSFIEAGTRILRHPF